MAKVIIMPDPNDPGWKGWLARFLMRRVLWIVAALALVLLVLANVYTVPSDSKAIVLRFGAISGVVDPGLHVSIPFADDIYVLPVARRQSFEFGFRFEGVRFGNQRNVNERNVNERNAGGFGDRPIMNEKRMLTRDNKLIEVEWVMHYHIEAPEKYLFNLPVETASREKMLRDLCMSTMRRIFANILFDEGLTSGKQKIQEQARENLQDIFDEKEMGIRIDEVLLQETNVSDAIREEYNSVTTAEEQVKTMVYQAEAHANKVIPEAEGRAAVLVNEGEAYKYKRIAEAEGEAARLNLLQEAYSLNPELTRLNMWVEGMTEVWKKLRVVFVDGAEDSGALKVLPLPLENFFRNTGPGVK